MGTPTADDCSYVTDTKAITYLKSFNEIERIDLKDKYPGASPEAIDLLNRMLQFNPFFRISVTDALEHPLFVKIRKPHKEMASENQVSLDFENETLDKEKLRHLFVQLILEYKDMGEKKMKVIA